MTAPLFTAESQPTRPLGPMLAWPRVRFTLLVALVFGLMHLGSSTPAIIWLIRTAIVSMLALLAFGLFERWPARLPHWMARWVLQLLAVLTVIPFGAILAFGLTGAGTVHVFMQDPELRLGFYQLLGPGLFFAPWIALGALVRQRDALAQHQALTFQLERSEFERKATAARMRLLQAQVQPHFLFNTLANVRTLVKAGSPQAPAVLDSLIAYLRASVTRLGDANGTVAQELQLVRAYLELMHMRMPDRLQFSLHADDAALGLRCPSLTLMTLVENSVRHGIDPCEEGGRIEVSVMVREGRCIARVLDNGVGLQETGQCSGTGLDNLRERMQLTFGEAQLRLSGVTPHGVLAELEFPAKETTG